MGLSMAGGDGECVCEEETGSMLANGGTIWEESTRGSGAGSMDENSAVELEFEISILGGNMTDSFWTVTGETVTGGVESKGKRFSSKTT